jgi:hypothetical protein
VQAYKHENGEAIFIGKNPMGDVMWRMEG